MGRPDVDGLNTGYAALLLEQYLDNPGAVPEEWRDLFESHPDALLERQPGLARLLSQYETDGDGEAPVVLQPAEQVADTELLGGVAAPMALVKAIRMHGHLAARLDPLGSEPPGDPALEPERLIPKLTPDLQARIPASLLRLHVDGETLADALPRLLETYTGSIAYEIEHISDHEERVWLRQAIESGRYRRPLSRDERVRLLRRLSQVEGMERYLRRAFLGQKQFSVEGLDVMIPMLDEAIELAAGAGAHEVVLGMAHRGRLNVLAHVVGRPYETILREFEGERTIEAVVSTEEGGSGDVKYHLGAQGTRSTPAGDITITLVSNPSHLEAADPVVEGRARAEQTDRSSRQGYHDPSVALPVLIHGDASFAGQGSVAETLNLQALPGYSTGGTLHLIANNQVGFTTDPESGRSTRYSSDLAKGFDIPIVHVNADDPEAALAAIRLALAYRRRFGHDVVVDLVGYRRHGHNEQDEAAYTQPLLAAAIADHPTAREQFAARLVADGDLTQEQADELEEDVVSGATPGARGAEGDVRPGRAGAARRHAHPGRDRRRGRHGRRRRPAARTQRAAPARPRRLHAEPEAHAPARAAPRDARGGWDRLGAGRGARVRLAPRRGDSDQAHRAGHRARARSPTGTTSSTTRARERRITPLQHLDDAGAAFEIYNSPLSEYACVGFEYGYAAAAPEALVLWEAQFGDFVNGAQIIIDQFIAAGLSKWRESTRLTLLLPHGYEGNGPEHSSARLERFLQLAAQENLRIANCTTSGQYFHLLRRQALDATARPLVVMTPKGLLRLKQAGSTLEDLANGEFRPVLDDQNPERERVERLVLCQGKIYYDIAGHEQRGNATGVAVARLEQLYPFPTERAQAVFSRLPEPPRGRVGAGGAAEHGRLAGDPAPAGGDEARGRAAPVRRPAVAREPERGLSDRAPPRAGQDRPRRAGRLARRRGRSPCRAAMAVRYERRRRFVAAFAARAASFGPCLRASFMSCRRWAAGSRRQMSQAPMASAHGVGRSLRNRPAMP